MAGDKLSDVWRSETDQLNDTTLSVRLFSDAESLSFSEVSILLQERPEFRSWFTRQLTDVPLDAYFWEMPPVTRQSMGRDFEYVLIRAPSLAKLPADPSAFRERFVGVKAEIVQFHNLGRDALLVAPVPLTGDDNYAHLGSFLRTAPETQINALWQSVFLALSQRLTDRPVWVSTSGLGVAWLHVRLDSIPKYYNYAPYQRDTG